MTIRLSAALIDAAVPRIGKGLEQYLWLQNATATADFFKDGAFRKRFNHFYRVRRGTEWQVSFYGVMDRAQKESLSFRAILDLLHQRTGRYEASFGSKLFATLNPTAPIIDSVVLKNLGVRLPSAGTQERTAKICEVHKHLAHLFSDFLATDMGAYLVKAVERAYPHASITKEKAVDLVLWQTRGPGRRKPTDVTVTLAPDVAKSFPTSEAVNQALRLLVKVAKDTKALI